MEELKAGHVQDSIWSSGLQGCGTTLSDIIRDAAFEKNICTNEDTRDGQKEDQGSWVCLLLKLQPNNPTMVAQLYYDILCVLFRFLDEGTLYNCSVVNKEFNFIASQNLYRKVAYAPKLWLLD